MAAERAAGGEAIEPGHQDIHQNEIRLHGVCRTHAGVAIVRHVHFVPILQHHAEPEPIGR